MVEQFDALFFIRFFRNHGLLNVNDRPQWRVIRNGSRSYVPAICKPFRDRIHTGTPIRSISRTEDGVTLRTDAAEHRFDSVVLAAHSDQALAMLGQSPDGPVEARGLLLRLGLDVDRLGALLAEETPDVSRVGALLSRVARDLERCRALVQVHDLLVGQFVQGHLDHAHGTIDDLPTSRDNGLGLLALEHCAGDFRRIGQVADACLDHLDTGLAQAVLHLGRELIGNLLGVAAQSDQVIVVRLVRVGRRQVA